MKYEEYLKNATGVIWRFRDRLEYIGLWKRRLIGVRKTRMKDQEAESDATSGETTPSRRPSTPVRSNLLTKREVLLSARKQSENGEVAQEDTDYVELDEMGKNR